MVFVFFLFILEGSFCARPFCRFFVDFVCLVGAKS